MNCLHPRRIKNQYNDKWLYVSCRHCDACKIASANQKSVLLRNELSKYKYNYLVTLDYDNDSVPYVLPHMMSVFRNASFERVVGDKNRKNQQVWKRSKFPIIIDDLDEEINTGCQLYHHPVNGAIGVLFYKDIQDFFKRFRKNLYKDDGKKDIKFGYFVCGEYGPNTRRPHYHIALWSNNLRYEDVKSLVVQSWPLCDWTRLKNGKSIKEESIKASTSGIGSYVSSYVNSVVHSSGIPTAKRFQQRTQRSKNVDFGIDSQSRERFERFIKGDVNSDLYADGRHIFERIDTSKLGSISISPISSRLFLAFFPKYKGISDLSFDDFARRARLIYSRYFTEFRKELIDSEFLKSADLSFMRGFKRYATLVGRPLDFRCFDDYLLVHYRASAAYASVVLKTEMQTYEQIGRTSYIINKINSYADDLEKKDIRFTLKLGYRPFPSQLLVSPHQSIVIHNYISFYKKKLLPKHFNDTYEKCTCSA